MKILFGIQGTGHGHISRAREILPELQKYAEVDVLISGYGCNLDLHGYRVDKKRGISLVYDRRGKVSFLKTIGNIKFNVFVDDLMGVTASDYDLVISDFEPITSWAARKSGIPVVGLSHQASFLSHRTPRPPVRSFFAEKILRHYAPCTHPVGFHFLRYDDFIQPPVIRSEVRNLIPTTGDHVTVYLPAYEDPYLVDIFSQLPEVDWELFSIHTTIPHRIKNCLIQPVENHSFLKSLECSYAVMTGGGFETCAESLFLGKKLMVIPITNQYEQQCNAAALSKFGVPVLQKLEHTSISHIDQWLNDNFSARLPEYCNVPILIRQIIQSYRDRRSEAA